MIKPYYSEKGISLYLGDCLEEMKKMPDNSIDTIITDPPYGLEFMGKIWDASHPPKEIWQEVLRVAKPGATLLCFGGTRTWHRLACAIEDAGWIIKDTIMWIHGQGFPKATDISKQLDKKLGGKVKVGEGFKHAGEYGGRNLPNPTPQGEEREEMRHKPDTPEAQLWNGWKSHGLKPAYEPIIMAMKPNEGSYAENALKWGVAGLNIDGGRINYPNGKPESGWSKSGADGSKGYQGTDTFKIRKMSAEEIQQNVAKGRFPANLILECICDEVITEPTEIKEPEEIRGGIWRKSEGKPAGRMYKGGNQIHTNPECPCYMLDKMSGKTGSGKFKKGSYRHKAPNNLYQLGTTKKEGALQYAPDDYGDSGGASRFFYTAKASRSERGRDNKHPTVKPLALMKYLCTLTKTPTGGIVLDPFLGSGTTLIACKELGCRGIGIEISKEYCDIAIKRLKNAMNSLF